MPRQLKRRSDQISRDPSPPSASPSASPAPSSQEDAPTGTTLHTLSNKLVRYALSTAYSRTPLRRADITAKILRDAPGGPHPFKAVFNAAQDTLRQTFGMELVDAPVRERTTLNDRRKAAGLRATQKATQTQTETQPQPRKDTLTAAQSWILVSILPAAYKSVSVPTHNDEATYFGLCTFVVALIYLNAADALPDAKLERYLRRVGVEGWVPIGGGLGLQKVLQRMVRDGYVERGRDVSSGEEVVEWSVGARGRREISERGVAGLIRAVYGFGGDLSEQPEDVPVKMERDELERRLVRSLGEDVLVEEVLVPAEAETEADTTLTPPRRSQ